MEDERHIDVIAVARKRASVLSWQNFFGARTVGFALIRAWVYLMFLGAAVSNITWNGQAVSGNVFTLSTIALCIMLFGSAFFPEHFCRFMNTRLFRATGPFFTVVGTLLIASTTLPNAPSLIFNISGGLFTGIGSALIDLGYGELYRNVDPKFTAFEAPFAFFLAACLFPLVHLLPSQFACLVCAALPLTSGLILFKKLKVWLPSAPGAPQVQPVQLHLGRFAWRIGICACLIGLADGVVRAAFMSVSQTTVEDFYLFPLVWASILTITMIYGCTLFSRETGLRPTYKLVMLVMALFFMLLPVLTSFSELESIIALTGYGTFNVLIWILLADISFNYRFSSVVVFGVGWGMVTLGVLLGSLIGQGVCTHIELSPQILSLIALLATLAILVSYMFVFKESDLIALTKADSIDEKQTNDNSPRSHHRPFQERCKDVAKEYGLSPKETEIMILFAKGRSSTRIQEELYLSRGTVTTHLRHIYQKMDVHSKQEFLDVIEGRAS